MGWLLGGVFCGVVVGVVAPAWGVVWCALSVVGAVVGRWWAPGWGAAGLALGLAVGQTVTVGPELDGFVHLRGRICSAPMGRETRLCLVGWTRTGEPWREAEGPVLIRVSGRPPPVGSWVVATGRAGDPARTKLPGAPDTVRQGWRAGVVSLVRVDQLRLLDEGQAEPEDPRELSPLLYALATGDRSRASPELLALFRRTGTAHLLAVSGLHVGLVGAGVAGLFLLGFRLVAVVFPAGLPSGLAWFGGALAAAAYADQVGWTASASRAALMFCVAALLLGLGRKPAGARLLLVAAVCLACADPGILASPAFQLSFGATLSLFRVYPIFNPWISPSYPLPVRFVLRSFAITVAATLGTVPAVAWWFQELSAWGPVANLVAVPLVAWVLVPSALWLCYGPELCWGPVRWVAGHTEAALLAFLSWIPEHALHPAVGPVGAVLLVLPLLLPRRIELWLLVGALAFGLHERPTQLEVEILDVGQGSAALIHLPGSAPILVDGGPPSRQLLHYLRRRGIHRLRAMVASHGDRDHVGGLELVLSSVEVDELWIGGNGAPALAAIAELRSIPMVGCAELLERSLALELWCDPQAASENDGSLVLAAGGVLLPGDLSAAGERRLLASDLGAIQVLVLAHHGSRFSSSEELVGALAPELGVVSAGRHNSYGHPHPLVIERLHSRDIPVLSTATHGTIQLRPGPELSLRHHQPGFGWSPWLNPDALQPDGPQKRTPQGRGWPGGWRSLESRATVFVTRVMRRLREGIVFRHFGRRILSKGRLCSLSPAE